MPLARSIIDHTLLQLHNTGKWDNFIFKEGVRALLSFSLIKLVSSKGIYTMHPLIHGWGRDRMSSEDRQKYCLMAYGLLACSLPEDFDEQPYQFRRILVTHLRANIQHSVMAKKEMVDNYFDDAHEKFGRMLSEQGYADEAEKFQIQVLDVRSRTLGEEHPDTMRAMGDLAISYRSLGKYADAEKLDVKVLDMRNRLLGEDHPDTITAINKLGISYSSLGKYADAERLAIIVLDMRSRLLGEDHPDTIWAMGNLASTYESLGKYVDAERLTIKVLDIRNRLLGEDHPDTICAMSNLATSYGKLGKYTDAQKLEIEVLNMRNRLLGEEHPDTINGMENLAITLFHLQNYTDAARLEVQVVDVRMKIFGEEHPETVKAVELLAEIRSQANTDTSATESKETGESYLRKHALVSSLQLIHIFITLAHHLTKIASRFSKILKRKVLQYSNISHIIDSYFIF